VRAREAALTNRIDRDRELVETLRRGEPTAAERLVRRYGDRTYRLAIGMTGNRQDAEEVVQDALWTVVRKIDTFRAESAFGTWVYRIVTNAAYQKLRRRPGRRAEVAIENVLPPPFDEAGQHAGEIPDWSASVDEASRGADLRLVLRAAIDKLPADYRSVLLLRDIEGLSNAEVAQALRIAVATVKSRVHRARLFLRKRLALYFSARRADEDLPRPGFTPTPLRSGDGGRAGGAACDTAC
jgi:RNA polymerase sigma-70 factor (ECF subfamily)